MACVENIPPLNEDSEMEEGEIVDDLSDISSEEEFLLRQRLQVLENYNNVLERKKAKRSSIGSGSKHKKEDTLPYELSEISATELDEYYSHAPYRPVQKVQKRQKTHHRQKRKKEEPISNFIKTKDHKKKNHYPKKKIEVKVISESSEESEDEYRNRRRKLADAVVVNKDIKKNDKTSLSERLQKMLCGVNPESMKTMMTDSKVDTKMNCKIDHPEFSSVSSLNIPYDHTILTTDNLDGRPGKTNSFELIDLCTDEDSKTVSDLQGQDTVDSLNKITENAPDLKKDSDKDHVSDKDSDDDLELLRQHALKTKTSKAKVDDISLQPDNKIMSEDEDSDTAELRLICLKSALLKKAIEMKQKQKLKKKLSQSSNVPDEFLNSNNNTDIESVDMDIGSDVEDKTKENPDGCAKIESMETHTMPELTKAAVKDIPMVNVPNEDELEDDEDLLRAKLLTSLSKNLPNLVNPNILESIESIKDTRPTSPKPTAIKPIAPPIVVPEEKRIIINLGESDSEGEHEATKNLTKMHIKLSEQIDFQQRLDMFLKSTRMEVEKTTILPDVVQQPALPKKNEKFVAKAVKHLPKSEQIEYKNLVKRMAELEKIKQARQSSMNLQNKINAPMKETLKPRNAAIEASKISAINSLEEKINASRKHIAEESAKMLKLKEEGMKLSQKYKIVATELRNLKTAIALNKKQTRSVQSCLTKIRLHHQMLLKSSITSSHSKINGNMPLNQITTKLQKENYPAKEEHKAPIVNKSGRVIVKENHQVIVEHKNSVIQKSIRVVREVNSAKEDPNNLVVHKLTKLPAIEMTQAIDEQKSPIVHKSAKDVIKQTPLVVHHPRLSVELDVTSNKKLVRIPDDKTCANGNSLVKEDNNEDFIEDKRLSRHPVVEKGGGNRENVMYYHKRVMDDDYKSPLGAFGSATWEGDPNAILCPFEVGGDCKDSDCKYLHTNSRSK